MPKGVKKAKYERCRREGRREKNKARAHKSNAIEKGRKINVSLEKSISWMAEDEPVMKYLVRVKVPFSYSFSKNAIYSLRKNGHIYLRKEAINIRDALTWEIIAASKGHKWKQNKVWLDILVQKPNHKGDAINVVDTVCDAVKRAIKVDDRWFCIRRLDWQIVKKKPQLVVGVGQEEDEDKQVCSYCGRILPLTAFTKNKFDILGVGRECKECRTRKTKRKKK